MNILITRPFPDGKELTDKLRSIGKNAYHLPLIHFSTGKNLKELIPQLNLLSEGDFLFIISQYAVKYAHLQLSSMGKYWPTTIQYYSIGHATSLKMYAASGILSKYPYKEETSESLLQLPELIYISGRRALILRGNNGCTILNKTLQKRGALVLCCECYIRKPFQYNGQEQCAQMIRRNINTIVITSGEMLKQLYYLIPQHYRMTWLIQCKLIVISTRLAILAQNLGWTNIIIAKSANNKNLLHTLIQCT